MYYGVSVEEQEQKRIQEYLLKKQIDYDQAVAKENMKNEARMELATRKIQLQEYRREMRKAEYDEIIINCDGKILIQTKNGMADTPERQLTNFCFREIIGLVSSDGEDGYFCMSLQVNGSFRKVIFDGSQTGKVSYLKRKINEIGARILTSKKSVEEQCLTALWGSIYQLCNTKKVIPTHKGWIIDENGCVKFVREGDILWDRILKQAK